MHTASTITDGSRKLVDRDMLEKIVSEATEGGKSVVLATGCFDLLHHGHITMLMRARLEGDLLIVAINSDDSIRSLKGDFRPFIPLDDRIASLEQIESVDIVVVFEEHSPATIIRAIRPNILVKGGDYASKTITGAEDVLTDGGRVVTTEFVPGISSSRLAGVKA